MTEPFDPYYTWLGIPPREQPPHHYRLLSLEVFEDNADAIEHAADRQMLHVRTFQTGPFASQSQTLLNELAAARACLLEASQKRRYDDQLRKQLDQRSRNRLAETPLPAPPAAAALSDPRLASPPPPHALAGPQRPSKTTPTKDQAIPRVVANAASPPPRGESRFFRPSPRSDSMAGSPPTSYRRRRRRSVMPVVLFTGGVFAILVALFAIAAAAGLFAPKVDAPRVAARKSQRVITIADQTAPSPSGRSARRDRAKHQSSKTSTKKSVSAEFDRFVAGTSSGEAESNKRKPETVAVSLSPGRVAVESPTAPEPTAEPPKPKVVKPSRFAPPQGALLDTAETEMQSLYGDKIAKVKTVDEHAALAELLLKDAGDVDLKPDVRWLVLKQAYQRALDAGDFGKASRAVESIAADYDVDSLTLRTDLLKQAALEIKSEPALREVTLASIELVPTLIANKRFGAARQLAGKAENIAWRTLRDAALRKSLQEQIVDVSRSERRWQAAEDARGVLEDDPEDPDASLTYGRYLVGVEGDWGKGLALLENSSDATWRLAAEQDLARPGDFESQAQAADAWKELGEANPDFPGLLARAQNWYERAREAAPRADESKIQGQLDEIIARHLDRELLVAAKLPRSRPAVPPMPMSPSPTRNTSVTLLYSLAGHTARINQLAYSPKGKLLASVADDASLRLWNTESGKSHVAVEGHDTKATHVAFSLDGETIASAGDKGARNVVKLWNTKLDRLAIVDSPATSLDLPAFVPDGKGVVAATGDHVVKLFDLEGKRRDVFFDNANPIRALSVSPDGKLLAAAGDSRLIKLYNLTSRRLVHTSDVTGSAVIALRFSADSSQLAALAEDGDVFVVPTSAPSSGNRFNIGASKSIVFIARGRGLAVAGNKQITFWDVDKGERRAELKTHGGLVSSLAISPDGKMLASAGLDNEGKVHVVKVWQVRHEAPTAAGAGK